MSKAKRKEDLYRVSDVKHPENEIPKWNTLSDLNIEIRNSVSDIMKKLITIKTVIEKDLSDSKELLTTLKGTEDVFKEILDKIEMLTKLHSRVKDGKIVFFVGDVKIQDDKENSLFIDTLTSYMHLGEMLDNFTNVSITTLMAEYTEAVEKQKKENENGK